MQFEYTFANEDSFTEQKLLKLGTSHVLAVAGSGARVLPLFSKMPKKLTCVDTCSRQIFLTELRIQALRQLSYSDFCTLLGYQNATTAQRKRIFYTLTLSSTAKEYLSTHFEKIGWQSILFSGVWESKFEQSARLFGLLLPNLKDSLVACQSVDDQKELYVKNRAKFKLLAWLITLRLFIAVFVEMVRFQNKRLTFATPIVFFRLFNSSIKKAFGSFLIKSNFYYSVLLTGCYNSRIAPTPEINQSFFHSCKAGALDCEIAYINDDIFGHCSKVINEYSFVSMSNVPDYVAPDKSLSFLNTLEEALTESAILIYRRSITHQSNRIDCELRLVSDFYRDILNQDSTPFYNTYVFEK